MRGESGHRAFLKERSMKRIPVMVQKLYQYFDIPKSDWQEHYNVDIDISNQVRPEVSRVYRLLFNELKDARRIL
jgi:hypothetical protein